MTHFRIISDIHGRNFVYTRLVRGEKELGIPPAKYTLQLGDLNFSYGWMFAENIDPEFHKFFGGNHDNYDVIDNSPNCLGDFGVYTVPEFGDIFFVRGAWSIDVKYRDVGVDWWEEEELSVYKCNLAIELYEEVKPDFVVTHSCPYRVLEHLALNPQFAIDCGWDSSYIRTRTNQMLDRMMDIHQPRHWIFGHFHQDFNNVIDGTVFTCINQYEYLDFGKGYNEVCSIEQKEKVRRQPAWWQL